MSIKNIVMAAAAALTLGLAAAPAADAAPFHPAPGNHAAFDRGFRDGVRDRRIVDHRVVFEQLRGRHIRYAGNPYFVRGHYVVRSFDRFNRVTFVEVNPYTGQIIGFIRL
jgi:hypothetical protein